MFYICFIPIYFVNESDCDMSAIFEREHFLQEEGSTYQ